MSNDFDSLSEKIRKARGEDNTDNNSSSNADAESDSRQGIQAGAELVVAIIASTAIGYGLDMWLETKPAFILLFFFLGVCTGFYNVYRISQKMGTAVGQKDTQKSDKNALQQAEKDAKTSHENRR